MNVCRHCVLVDFDDLDDAFDFLDVFPFFVVLLDLLQFGGGHDLESYRGRFLQRRVHLGCARCFSAGVPVPQRSRFPLSTLLRAFKSDFQRGDEVC